MGVGCRKGGRSSGTLGGQGAGEAAGRQVCIAWLPVQQSAIHASGGPWPPIPQLIPLEGDRRRAGLAAPPPVRPAACTWKISHSMSNSEQAKEREAPHWPAPVSVVSFFTPSCLLYLIGESRAAAGRTSAEQLFAAHALSSPHTCVWSAGMPLASPLHSQLRPKRATAGPSTLTRPAALRCWAYESPQGSRPRTAEHRGVGQRNGMTSVRHLVTLELLGAQSQQGYVQLRTHKAQQAHQPHRCSFMPPTL